MVSHSTMLMPEREMRASVVATMELTEPMCSFTAAMMRSLSNVPGSRCNFACNQGSATLRPHCT